MSSLAGMPSRAGGRLTRARALAACLAGALCLSALFVPGCGVPTREAYEEAQADRGEACALAETYLEEKYGLSEGEAVIKSASPYYVSLDDLGEQRYISSWDFEAEVQGESCAVAANLEIDWWCDNLQGDALADAVEADIAGVVDSSDIGEVEALADCVVNYGSSVKGLSNGLFDGENPFKPLKGGNFSLTVYLECHDGAAAARAVEAIDEHYTDDVLQGAYLRVELGYWTEGWWPGDRTWREIAAWSPSYYNDTYGDTPNPYPREAIVPGESCSPAAAAD